MSKDGQAVKDGLMSKDGWESHPIGWETPPLGWQRLSVCLSSPVRQAPVPLALVPPAALAMPAEAGDKMPGGRPCTAASAPTPAEPGQEKITQSNQRMMVKML